MIAPVLGFGGITKALPSRAVASAAAAAAAEAVADVVTVVVVVVVVAVVVVVVVAMIMVVVVVMVEVWHAMVVLVVARVCLKSCTRVFGLRMDRALGCSTFGTCGEARRCARESIRRRLAWRWLP